MPISKQIHQDKALENVSVAYTPGEFIANKAIPSLPVKHDTDKYYIFDFGMMRLEDTKTAKQAPTRRVKYDMSTSSYTLVSHRLKDIVLEEDRKNADKAINMDIDTTEIITKKILIRNEVDCATLLQTSGNWSNSESLTSTVAWSQNTTLSNPITKIDSGSTKIIASSGYMPNQIVMDDGGFVACKEHVSIVDRVKHTSAESVTEAMLARLFRLKNVFVGRAIYDSAGEGLDSVSAPIWTNTAHLSYMEPSPGLKKASAAYRFQQSNMGNPYRVDRWAEEDPEGDWIRVWAKYDQKAVATACAYVFIDIT